MTMAAASLCTRSPVSGTEDACAFKTDISHEPFAIMPAQAVEASPRNGTPGIPAAIP
jgi:hypothetical protein